LEIANATSSTEAARPTMPIAPSPQAGVVFDGWRVIWLFLITRHGVREVGAQLNFLKAATNGQERNNFRFDAVSSMGVTINNQARHILELTLTNGPSRTFRIADSSPESASKSDETDSSTDLDLDAAGFSHTLHVLEGIAAEGKSWINRRPRILTP
jgi:hypothetical protein